MLVESPQRDTCNQAVEAQSRPTAGRILQATAKPRPRMGLSFARAVGRATGIWGASCTMFFPPRRTGSPLQWVPRATRRGDQPQHGKFIPLRTSRVLVPHPPTPPTPHHTPPHHTPPHSPSYPISFAVGRDRAPSKK